MTRLAELVEMYSALPPDEIVQAFQIALADLIAVKRDHRAGRASAGDLRDATADYQAINGVYFTLVNRGAL